MDEIGVYELIFGSNTPMAKEFRKYVFETIIPSFRKQILEDTINDRLFGNQKCIMTEFDLQVHVVSYLRKIAQMYYSHQHMVNFKIHHLKGKFPK